MILQNSAPFHSYPDHFSPGQDPLMLAYVSSARGFSAPPLREPFSYLELGCGTGRNLEILATAYPHAQFHGIDHDEISIQEARQRQEKFNLTNLVYHCKDFGKIDGFHLPPCHYISFGRLWSRIDESSRQNALRLMDEVLVPEGLLFMEYKALPGSRTEQELFHFIYLFSQQVEGSWEDRLSQALSYLDILKENQAPFFKESPEAEALLQQWRQKPLSLLAQEIRSTTPQAFRFQEITDALEPYGLVFAGRFPFFTNFLALSTPPGLLPLLRQIENSTILEQHLRFMTPLFLHKEIYSRQKSPLLSTQPKFDSFFFTTTRGHEGWNRAPRLPFPEKREEAQFDFSQARYDEIFQALEKESRSLRDLETIMSPEKTEQDLIILINSLMMGEQILPTFEKTPEEVNLPPSFQIAFPFELNEENLREFVKKEEVDLLFFASPLAGTTMKVHKMEALCLLSFLEEGSQGAAAWLEKSISSSSWANSMSQEQRTSFLETVRRALLPKLQALEIITVHPY